MRSGKKEQLARQETQARHFADCSLQVVVVLSMAGASCGAVAAGAQSQPKA
jgi:hypothetical protein